MPNRDLDKDTTRRRYLTPAECARRLNVAPVTLRKWARQGMLKAVVTPGGHRRYALDEVARFAAEYGLPFQHDKGQDVRILIVDDDLQLCRYLSELFARCGRAVITEVAHDGFEAGHQLHTFQPDLVLLDLMMPGVDGYEVCKTIKSHTHTQHIRVIAMTGFYTHENIDRVLQAGAEICLAKPVERDVLLEKIDLDRYVQR